MISIWFHLEFIARNIKENNNNNDEMWIYTQFFWTVALSLLDKEPSLIIVGNWVYMAIVNIRQQYMTYRKSIITLVFGIFSKNELLTYELYQENQTDLCLYCSNF